MPATTPDHNSLQLPQPGLVVAADWSVNPRKRWMTRAERQADETYLIFPPEPVNDVSTLLHRLQDQADGNGLFIGFDFPLGWPIAYARQTEFDSFLQAFPELGHNRWAEYYTRTDAPRLRQPFAPLPKSAGQKGNYLKDVLVALKQSQKSQLLRRCERKTATRAAAECLFFTCGPKQVGAGAIVGWRDMLSPAFKQIQLWPFHGSLAKLLAESGPAIAEVYPSEAYQHLGLKLGAGSSRKKSRLSDRQWCGQQLLKHCQQDHSLRLTHATVSWWESGFLSDDDFDSTVGLLHMLGVLAGRIPHECPDDDATLRWEGWILGQAVLPASL